MTLLRKPAVQALLLQGAACLPTFLVLWMLDRFAGMPAAVWLAVLVQGVSAAVLSWWRGLAAWWLPIQFFFPACLALMLALRLPPVLYLFFFFGFLTLYWGTYRTQVPYYPSSLPVWQAVTQLAPAERSFSLIDIGSGFGGMVMHLADARADARCIGVELAPLPWLVSVCRARLRRNRGQFFRRDYMQEDLADYDVVFAYLSPAAMPALWEKARREMRPGALLLSYEFSIPGHPADLVLHPVTSEVSLFGWRM